MKNSTSRNTFVIAGLLILAFFITIGQRSARAQKTGTQTSSPVTMMTLRLAGTGSLGASTSIGQVDGSSGLEFRSALEVDHQRPSTGLSFARVPADHVPSPTLTALASSNPGFSGFDGLTHRDQRLAGTGAYTDTQFSLEPPDQGLCVGNGKVLEVVNTALAVYDTAGNRLKGPTALNQFLGLRPEIIRSTPFVFGDFTSDPKCYFDWQTGRWFLTVLQLDVDASTGDFTGRTHIYIAVTKTGDPGGQWNIFVLDATNDGQNGTPAHPNCPCFGDQPLIGADANGFYVSTNEFPLFAPGFNGAQVYAMSKTKLASGKAPTVVHFEGGPLEEGISYSVQPATVPPGGTFETAVGGTEYFLSALEFTGGLDDRIAVWALTNTSSLPNAVPAVALSHAVIASEVYGIAPVSQQKSGPTPLADFVLANFGRNEKLELLDSNDDRMQQVVFASGQLWSALSAPVKQPTGVVRAGIAWFAVTPSISAGSVSGTVVAQGYVSVNGTNVTYPSIAMNTTGQGALTFTLVGPDLFPSAAYTTLQLSGTGAVHIAAAGSGPDDGVTGYSTFGFGRVARWGDYSAAVADEAGNLWLAVEYIPNAPRTLLANWGTFVSQLIP